MKKDLKVALIGLGAIGIVTARHFSRQQQCQLTCFTRHPAPNGQYTITQSSSDHFQLEVFPRPQEHHLGQFDLLVFCLKNQVLEETFHEYKALLRSGGYVLCAQNGLMEYFLRDHFPRERILGAVVKGNAIYQMPDKAMITVPIDYTVGPIVRQVKVPNEILQTLCSIERLRIVDDVIPYKWSKLIINCVSNPLSTLYGTDPYTVLASEEGVIAGIRLAGEMLQVAERENVKVARDHRWWPALFGQNNGIPLFLKKKYLKWIAFGWKGIKVSMLQDIESGRSTEIDYLNGLIVRMAQKHGIAVPHHQRIVELIKKMEKRELQPSLENLKLLHI